MFDDDITPESVDSLVAQLYAMLEVESIPPAHMPTARMTVTGTVRRVELQVAGTFVIIDSGKRGTAYAFAVDDFLGLLRQVSLGCDVVRVREFDGWRVMNIDRHGERLSVVTPSTCFSVDAADFLRCAARAGLGVST